MEQTQHSSRQFDAELENIRGQVLTMGGLVEHQIVAAIEALRRGDLPLIDQVIQDEDRINRFEREIDELCTNVIAIRAPTAIDLRFVTTVLKTITDLERIGDEAKKIALLARRMLGNGRWHVPRYGEVKLVSGLVVEMLHRSLDAFARLDAAGAPEVVRLDDEVDALFKSVLRQLLTYMIEDPRTISDAIDIIFIAKALERIGDHAKNVSEHVVYLIKGKDVRHVSLEEIEQAVKS
jgi:phosphate transport system protein